MKLIGLFVVVSTVNAAFHLKHLAPVDLTSTSANTRNGEDRFSSLDADYSRRRSLISTLLGTAAYFFQSAKADAKVSTSNIDLQKIYDEGASTYESLYTDSIVSRTLDFSTLRADLLSKSIGDVLEIGVGTGLNLPHYYHIPLTDKAIIPISSYTAIDLSPKMMEQAKARFAHGVPNVATSLDLLYKQKKVEFILGDVNNLSSLLEGKKFDTIVDTFSLCVFPQPLVALKQAKKMLAPGGKLLLLEHQKSIIGTALNPTRNIADVISTCRYDDDVLGLLRSAGFENVAHKTFAGGFLLQITAS